MIATTLPYKTPIVPCNGMNQENEIFIKRDDLLPFSFGGNKARIAWEFLEDMRLKGANCLIGYGSTKSNLSRVLANACCARGIKCHIIAADDVSDVMKETNNHTIVNMCGAVVHRCSKANVAQTVERVWRLCEEEGYKPYYIYGNKCGVGNEAIPVNAYVKAHSEIAEPFDYIFLATGTGMTQAGLIAGARLEQTHEKIVGISIARPREQVMAVVRTYLNAYYATRGTTSEVNDDVNVIDFCQGGGTVCVRLKS